MVSDDLGFLLIFIVLPTVLIVSGIWMVFFIRRDFTLRSSVQRRPRPEAIAETEAPGTRSRDELWAEALEDAEPDGEEPAAEPAPEDVELPVVIAALPDAPVLAEDSPGSDEEEVAIPLGPESRQALSGADGLSAALLNDPDNIAHHSAIDTHEPLPLAAEEDSELIAETLEHQAVAATGQRPGGNTEQIEPLQPDDAAEPDETGADAAVAVDDESLAPQDADIPSGNTAPLPEPEAIAPVPANPARDSSDEEVQPEDDEDDGEAVESGRRRRQPLARLTRSTENVRRRARGGRRAPPIARPGLRDEDVVEREDGG